MSKKEKLEKLMRERNPFRAVKPIDLMAGVPSVGTEEKSEPKQPKRGKQESKKVRKLANKKESTQEGKLVNSELEWLDQIASDILGETSTSYLTANTFRYSPDELKDLERVVYELKQHDFKISRNAIIRMGLRLLLKDFDERKQESLLIRFLAKKRR